MKVGDLVKWGGFGIGVVTQVNRDRGTVFVHFRDKAHWIMGQLVRRISESR